MKKTIQLFVVMLALVAGAYAQIQIDPTIDSPSDLTYLNFNGDQTSAGRYKSLSNEMDDNTFVFSSSNRTYSSMNLTVSFTYSGQDDFEAGNDVTGGTWNLAIYRDGNYAGSVFGDVIEGRVKWDVAPTIGPAELTGERRTYATMSVTGGTGEFGHVVEGQISFESAQKIENNEAQAEIKGITFDR